MLPFTADLLADLHVCGLAIAALDLCVARERAIAPCRARRQPRAQAERASRRGRSLTDGRCAGAGVLLCMVAVGWVRGRSRARAIERTNERTRSVEKPSAEQAGAQGGAARYMGVAADAALLSVLAPTTTMAATQHDAHAAASGGGSDRGPSFHTPLGRFQVTAATLAAADVFVVVIVVVVDATAPVVVVAAVGSLPRRGAHRTLTGWLLLRQLTPAKYAAMAAQLRPDACVALADEVPSDAAAKRLHGAVVRTQRWLDETRGARRDAADRCSWLPVIEGGADATARDKALRLHAELHADAPGCARQQRQLADRPRPPSNWWSAPRCAARVGAAQQRAARSLDARASCIVLTNALARARRAAWCSAASGAARGASSASTSCRAPWRACRRSSCATCQVVRPPSLLVCEPSLPPA
eukprot:scaffold4369_cov336-Prasinococcus_capsulatus_cf.AAC.5